MELEEEEAEAAPVGASTRCGGSTTLACTARGSCQIVQGGNEGRCMALQVVTQRLR